MHKYNNSFYLLDFLKCNIGISINFKLFLKIYCKKWYRVNWFHLILLKKEDW